jgi:hypothetical protein
MPLRPPACFPSKRLTGPTVGTLTLACICSACSSTSTKTITWEGYLIDDPLRGEQLPIEDARLEILDSQGLLGQAQELLPDYPGYWQAELPPEAEFQLKIRHPQRLTSVFWGATPGTTAIWIPGSFYVRDPILLRALLDDLDPAAPDPSDAQTAALWISPYQIDSWQTGLSLSLDSLSEGATEFRLRLTESGSLRASQQPVPDLYLAVGLAPGDHLLRLRDANGAVHLELNLSLEAGEIGIIPLLSPPQVLW